MKEFILVLACLVLGVTSQRLTRRINFRPPSHWRNYGGFGNNPHHRSRSRRMGIMMSGPNVCVESGQSYCCPGWTTNAANKCLLAICDSGCGGGICLRPNECLCPSGVIAPTCEAVKYMNGKCSNRCLNGGHCQNRECECTDGYTGASCGQPICGPGCLNGGRCIGPNKCLCNYGFTGNRCQTDYRVGPCFLTRANETCMDQVPGVTCHKKLCCATIGQGWGIPCEECPARVGNCSRGRMPPHCEDINECKLIPGLCKDGECVNTDGSFRCECAAGYKYNNKLHVCLDIDECELGYCENGECANTEGGFMCECGTNYKLSADRSYCIFDAPGYCYTTIESGMCADPLDQLTRRTDCCCQTVGTVEQETLGKCFAIPNHGPERCPTLGTPEFNHQCDKYSPGNEGQGQLRVCEIMGEKACVNGVCEAVGADDFRCRCNEGYVQTANMKACVDKNECGDPQSGSDICGGYGTCMNTDGGYECHCDAGFTNDEDELTCVDIDECEEDDGKCENGKCINTRGSFICHCNKGYESTATQQGCRDTDECLLNNDLCEFGRCVNIVGDYKCVCNPGFVASENGRSCIDEDECLTTGMCENGECINRNGGFKCMCNNGYELTSDGKHCKDINECLQKPCINGECENLDGNFICHCHRFQRLDETGRRCILELRTANCYRNVRNGQCTEINALQKLATRSQCCCAVPGGMSAWDDCEPCPERGSSNHAVLCSGVVIPNPCQLQIAPCSNGACINMEGNEFRCECNPGFLPSADGKSCNDIDECSEGMMVCSNGQCRNTPGSYVCTCDDGFLLNGGVCEDVNECESNPCVDGECDNNPGSFMCVCGENYVLDIHGLRCYSALKQQCWKTYENNTCSDSFRVLTQEMCCNSIGGGWGDQVCTSCAGFTSPCPKGYFYNVATDKCKDIPECSHDVCDDVAECVETEGSFICVCPEPLTLDATGTRCLDLRVGQCFYDYDESAEECVNPQAAPVMRKAHCCCTTGQGWGDPCEECPASGTPEEQRLCADDDNILVTGLTRRINECVLSPDLCKNGICKNTVDSFYCICNNGFTIDTTGRHCVDIKECDISPELCSEGNGTCINTEGSFRCDCDEGYRVSPDGNQCEDINECFAGGKCTGGDCENTEGSYVCTCPEGRALNEDGTRCIDVDECSVMKELCQPNGQCVNMLGFYMCVCNPGFMEIEDRTNCIDIDECENENGKCSDVCVNTIGSYECRCLEGFTLTYDGHTCADVDECIDQPNRCDGGRCENTEGGFVCVCFDGFMATAELDFCDDINECEMNPNICLDGLCHNTRGSYTCNCDPGYCVPQGQMVCVDEDECQLGKHTCDVNADCSNTEGSFDCDCISGFSGDGFECDDYDECLSGNDTCDVNAFCENTLGSFTCDCEDGFHGDGYSCSDKDDCLADENLCGPHGTCLNIQGSFECECPMGFMTTADKKACKDIDECAIEHICENGRCHNVPGTFRCDCLTGFEKDEQGANCTDTDECANVANCINGECVNTNGAYECRCPAGFTPNPSGVGCVDTRTGSCFLSVSEEESAPICSLPIGVDVVRSSCCCTVFAQGWGNPCELCPERNTSDYMTLCPGGDGFRPNPITVFLEDIDECMELPGLCQGGKCINVFGSFVCECREGYVLNEITRVCEDVDECTEGDEVCGPGTCVNSVGGYKCLCPEGYKPINRGRSCEDERQSSCFKYYNESSLQCTEALSFNTTKYQCCCYRGFGSGWNHPCEVCPEPDDGEFLELCHTVDYVKSAKICENIPDLCLNGECINMEGSDNGYRCECPLGFRYNEDLLICEDIDECAAQDGICVENAQCVNLRGSYRCNCRDGFKGNGEEECRDINECIEEAACANGKCENTEGGFICECDQGFVPTNGDEACDDVDECKFDPCGHGTCQNMIGSFVCSCDNGFTLGDNGDCVDINECAEQSVCQNGDCVNEPGTFSCTCDEGYKVALDRRSCLDINECVEDPTVCGVGKCTNLDGSYKCFCPRGYSDEGGTACVDENECELLDVCKGGDCINSDGSFNCICPLNSILSSNKKFCIDQTKGQCFKEYGNGTCANPMPTQVQRDSCCCRCTEAAWGETSGTCEECPKEGTAAFDDICPHGCGATLQGGDIDECLTNNPCVNGMCRNLAGGFVCICKEGYRLDATRLLCVDENECSEQVNPCGPGTCINRNGGFDCSCEPGYYNGPGTNCIDYDECAQPIHGCKFRCVNTEGSYICTCPDGFMLNDDERSCSDIDECSDPDLNRCEEKGMICKNQIGFFDCLCQPGYKKIGRLDVCKNIDECAETGVCPGGECIDEEGSYRCRCDEGYEYDEQGRICIDRREGFCYAAVHQRTCAIDATTNVAVSKTQCCCNKGAGWGPNCELCPLPSSREYVKLCPHGSGFDETGEDIDDCVVIPGLCRNGTCTNLLGSFKCICDRGFMPTENMQACVDIDECMMPNGCAGGSRCRNTQGGYKCECPTGYQITNTMRCVDIDECARKDHACQFICVNTIGSYDCGCPHGFVMHKNESCVDKDECQLDSSICGKNADCVNDVGGYHCVCSPGFEKTPNGDGCVGLPCDARPGICGPQMCMNMGEGIRCVPGCNPRMHLRFNPMRCYDVNDCRANPCGFGGRCMPNEQGQFRCGCNRGFTTMGRSGCGDINECRFQRNPCSFGCKNSYGGYQCGCPRRYFGVGGGHCMNGYGGFQQPAFPPRYGNQQYGNNQFGMSRCYDCPPVGPHRSRRSVDQPPMEEISGDDENRPAVNTSMPVILHINVDELSPKLPLLRLFPSLRTLRDHIQYRITSGNEDRMFKLHKDGDTHFVHISRRYQESKGPILPGQYKIKLEAKPTIDEETARRASMNNEDIENAMERPVKLEVEFDIGK